MVQDYKTINNKDGALSEGSSRLSDDDTESGCNTSSGKKFHNKFRTLLFAAVVTLAMLISMMARVVMMIAISSSSSNNGIKND